MENPELKIIQDDFEIQYEVVTAIDKAFYSSKDSARINEKLSSIDKRLSENQKVIDELNSEIDRLTNKADGLDYTIAVASGIICGLIDSFFVGEFSLEEGTKWGKNAVDSFVKKIAEGQGYSGNSIEGAVKFLENSFPIPSDSATGIFGGGTQHHLRDFAHHPNCIGLFFSLLTQFTGMVYGTDTSGLFHVDEVPNKDLIGKDLPSKLSIGIINWFFHMVSDMAGSSGSRVLGKYGTGLPGPLVSLLKELSALPFFNNRNNTNEFSVWISKLFNGTLLSKRDEYGKIIPDSLLKFDLRAELGVLHELGRQAIPVIINECIVRIFYFARRLYNEFKTKQINSFDDFIKKIDWKNTLPFKNRTIVRMLTIAHGTFVVVDVADAVIRSQLKGDTYCVTAILRINFIGLGRFAIAIGEDLYMGYKRGKLRNERMSRQTEQIFLSTAKVYYKQADMWIAAKDTSEAIEKLEETVRESILFLKESLISISNDLEIMINCKSGIDKNNPTLPDDILNTLEYGK